MTENRFLRLVHRYDMNPPFDTDGEFIGTAYTAWHLVDELEEIQRDETYGPGNIKVTCYMYDSGRVVYTLIPPAEWLSDVSVLMDTGIDE